MHRTPPEQWPGHDEGDAMTHIPTEEYGNNTTRPSTDEMNHMKAKLVLWSSLLPPAIYHALLYHWAIGFARSIQDAIQELRVVSSLEGRSEDWPQYLELIDGSAAKLLGFLKEMRTSPPYDRVELVCVNRLVHHFFFNEFPISRRKEVKIELSVDKNQSLYVRASPWGLKQVLQILTENAVQAMENSSIRNLNVSVEEIDPRFILIRMKDTGPGIPDELADRIFKEAFTIENQQGKGLGTALAAILIDHYGGEISIDKDNKIGASIIVSLPRCDVP